jgi:hypothetical protein
MVKKSFADCIDASNVAHGYLRSRAGTITTFGAPGAGTGAGQGTFPDQNDPSGGSLDTILTGAVCITDSCGASRTNRNEHYAARSLGGFSFASSRRWLRSNFCYQAITLIDPAVRGRHGGVQRRGSFEYIFEQSGS